MFFSIFVLLMLFFSNTITISRGEYVMPKYLQNKYGNSFNSGPSASPYAGTKTATKTKTKTKTHYSQGQGQLGGSAFNGHPPSGGCSSMPPTPLRAGLVCSSYGGCRATCNPNHQFPNGLTQLMIICKSGVWEIQDIDWDTAPACEPICLPPCQNSGICMAPNQCDCPENFSGPQCQYENKPCMNYPPLPRNSKRSCNSKTCTITCAVGHEFPDGSSIANMICKNGFWVPAKEKFSSIPDCQATCSPPCQNGGNCLSFNMCQCPQDFRGPQCQYRSEDCHARKLGFNGGYNCSGDNDSFRCSLSCPEGINFDSTPAPVYTCTYSTGMYFPRPIPQCVFPDNLEVIQGGGSSHTFYNMINGSDFNLNSLSINGFSKQGSFGRQYQKPLESQEFSTFGYVPVGQVGSNADNLVFVEQKLPKPGVCFTWQGTHFKTFDGKVFSFSSQCAHVLTRDADDNTFAIIVKNSDSCYTNNQDLCSTSITIFYQTKEYTLQQSPEGNPVFRNTKKVLPIPGQFPGLRSELSAHYIVISLDTIGVKVKWDGKLLVQVEVKENLWNRTEGLCGKLDGEENTDFLEKNGQKAKTVSNLAVGWQMQNLEEECKNLPQSDHACQSNPGKSIEALNFCNKLLQDFRFKPCHQVLDINTLLDACRWDYCSCQAPDPTSCSCETMNVYVRACSFNGVKDLANWRDENTCPMECTNGRVYKSCGPPTGQPACGSATEEAEDEQNCVEGCYCPEGTVFHENSCILRDQCPCKLRGKSFVSGSQVPKDCNTCTCSKGQWVCTQISCGARCSAVGDPHYSTFDGKKYDFMGQCSYYLIKTPTFSVEAENVACAGSISQAMNLPVSISDGLPSCTKAVTIRIENNVIKLKQNHELVVNGEDISKIPYQIGNVLIRSVSSLFLTVELPNGIELFWDGLTRVYIDIPPNFAEQTKGLCGSFNNNQKDDFLTPEGDVEQSVIPFANKWKTSEKCNDIPDKLKSDPCLANIYRKTTAEEHCKKLKSDLFAPCHIFVDPDQFYQDCLFDMCSCEFKISKCLCPTVAAYASECARKGIKIDWRNSVRECGIHCPGGQKYQICGNSCTRTCQDVSARKDCRPKCVEGCNCPEGEVMDDSGECIPVGKCKCYQDGMEFYPGYKEVRPASKSPELCTCINGNWQCRPASPEEAKDYPKASDIKTLCNPQENLEFTTCEPVEPVTCKNMHDPDFFTASVCHAGCKCKTGYVLDSSSKKCVKPTECPCHHGGRSYKENSTVQADCNTCKCKNGKWKCSENPCSAECSAWGDSHFKTFDGKLFDYQGQCDYALAKASLGANAFDISIQNVPCGSLGTSCSKSITIRIKSGADLETISLTKDKPLPNYQNLKHVIIRLKGMFVIVEALDLGLMIQWDRGTRVYVKVDPRWKNTVKGLCGNYNDNDGDDFQTPSGGITEASAQIFGDSWKLQPYCPEALDITDTCEDRPDRKVWALKQCGVLKSSLFSACHSEVPIDHYLEKCVFDSCACDQGGDCECLCTALAAYAQECNNHGVAIKWRSQHLCPMQCDERCSSYSPCISTCTTETCENLLSPEVTRVCKEETCIEGCSPKPCPPGQIYLNSSYLECVPRNICKPICLEIDDEVFYEGDKVEEDACHTCFCSRGHKVCKGHPCTTLPPQVTTQHQLEQNVQCRTGWTEWINQDKAVKTKTKTRGKKSDVEPLPNSLLLNNIKGGKCDIEKISKIECRTVRTHLTPKETGLDVECSLERGLICKSSGNGRFCRDFEIRVFCECEPRTTPAPICDPTQPHKEHPTDCHKFFHCDVTANGMPEYVEKTCGPSMYYNPVSMTCDWPYAVVEIKPECRIVTTTVEPVDNDELFLEPDIYPSCPPGFVKDECGIKCDQLCLYYNYVLREEGKCLNHDEICDSSCVSAEKRLNCPKGMFWANNETCVSLHDCSCTSHDNKPVKPGIVYRESDCKVCQCIDNFYTCDDSACHTTTKKPVTRVVLLGNHEIPVLPVVLSTVTPPEDCNRANFIDLVQGDQPLPDEAFSASSILSSSFKPHFARLDSKVASLSGGSWSPEYSDIDQYLDIDLGRQEPIYGVKIKGSPLYNEYVTSFKVFYSPDSSKTFLPVLNAERLPQIFRGSIDATSPVEQVFEVPFEAEIVRINPQTWHNGISLRVELIGCGEPKSTTSGEFEWITPSTPKPKLCEEEPMGLSNGLMSLRQVEVSSELDKQHSKKMLKISQNDAWQPLTNSPTEFVQFDFLEPRSIVGVITKGGEEGWVSAYTIKYSHDGTSWNPIIDKKTEKEQVFPGNYDSNSEQKNEFELPISTQLLRIIPTKWYNHIQMRVELLGCYKPYPDLGEIETTSISSTCNRCPGVDFEPLELHACRCTKEQWWDGENCVSRTDCPCMVGDIPYPVGTLFQKEDCSECLCKLGGTEHCNQKICSPCEEGMRSTVTAKCKCTCQPCPENTTLCPTSNICINSTLWCNGVQDCPDDEVNCAVPTTHAPEITSTKKPEKKCPLVECPPGYKKELREVTKATKYRSTYLSPMFKNSGRKNTKSQPKTSYNIKTKTPNRKPVKFLQKPSKEIVHEEKICPEYRCRSQKPPPKFTEYNQCTAVGCPPGYIQIYDEEDADNVIGNNCPKYTCYIPPPKDAVCTIIAKTFNTFDGVEYKYEICNHILARDLQNDEWDISLKKSCEIKTCTRVLVINHDQNNLVLHPDQTIEFDGFNYTIDQTKKIGSQTQAFSLQNLGNVLLFISNRYGFWIIWDKQGNAKLGVVYKLAGQVDGLCGYFNEDSSDDKRKPDGSPARTSTEFGDSWAQSDEICDTRTCPLDVQNKAFEMCNQVKDQVFANCVKNVDIEAFISRCLETTCECLQKSAANHTAEEECRCGTLQSFVVDCLATAPSTDLSEWRMQMDCPVLCDSPLVYHDCYQRKCEPTCESISDSNLCPKLPQVCFPGCYCPAGYVKKGETCIKPSSCRDCECNVLPHLQYITYDNSNFTVNGNCVYVMSRDVILDNDNKHKFQVLITNAPCRTNEEKTCVGKVTILYEGHKIHVLHDLLRNKLRLVVDGERIDDIEEELTWGTVRETSTKHYKILLTSAQVEVSVYFPSLGVSVKAPSHKYAGKLEGLCGDCNKDPSNDLQKPNAELVKDTDEFAISWLYDKLPGGQNAEMCQNKPKETCVEIAEELDPCSQILDANKFGQCLRILDPSLFLEWCKKDTCGNHPELSCTAIEAFARDCASAGFCVNWRNSLCPAKECASDQVYNACGSPCPKTCQNKGDKPQKVCKSRMAVEGCFCPEGKVFRNQTCVLPEDCEVCDEEGHHPGEHWKKDKCTSCRCEGVALKCETQQCSGSEQICQKGFQAVRIPGGQDECCDKYACLPEPTMGPTCETPQQIECGPGQVLKLDKKGNGCEQFICECKPFDECDLIETTQAPLEDGYERLLDDTGCCPILKLICNPKLCPKPKQCEQYYTLNSESSGKCCPFYSCLPPKDQCIHSAEFTESEEGGERPRTLLEKQKLLKNANETWRDGPCRECKCLLSSLGNYQSSCTQTDCSALEISQDYLEYELQPVFVVGQCCPIVERTACKVNGKVYAVGETWTKENDFCTTFECTNSTESGVQKEKHVHSCDTSCELGSEYVPVEKQCCGSCKPYACVVDGQIFKVGETWHSDDFCTNYFCLNLNGSMQVQSVWVNCPQLPTDYKENYVFETIPVEGECCKKHKTRACKVNGKVYKVNETWPSPDGDKCKSVSCVHNQHEEIQKQESVETCKKDCAKGWEYKESQEKCCGECVQTACVVDNALREPNENWTTPDGCTTFTCEELTAGQFVVSSQQESCPDLEDCPEANVYEKGCCKHCNLTAFSQEMCSPQAIALTRTVGLIKTKHGGHGNCTNEEEIDGFTECIGSCHSSTFFNLKSGSHESVCSCCKVVDYSSLEVDLVCEDGFKMKKKITVPSECGCQGCSAPTKYTKNTKH